MKIEGRVEFNGGPLEDIDYSYVIQQDILLGTLHKFLKLLIHSLTDGSRDFDVCSSSTVLT